MLAARTGACGSQRVAPVCLVVFMLVLGACRSAGGPIFDPVDPPILWPSPPQEARVSYVGQIASSSDLKATRSFGRWIGDLITGAEPPKGLYGPRSVVRTRDGERLWIADPGGRCLHLFDLESREYAKIDRVGDQQLLSPVGVCLGPPGTLYLCDSEAVAVYSLDERTGALQETVAGPESLFRPAALCFVESRNELFVVDSGFHDVKVLTPEGELSRTLGRRGSAPGELNFPCDIAAGDGEVWISDSGNHRVQALGYDGDFVAQIGRAGDAPGDLALPKGIALDDSGHVYVVDARFENVQIFDRSGQLLLYFGEEGPGPGEFWLPSGLFIDREARVWVCDSYNRRIQVFDLEQQVETHGNADD